MQPGWYDDPWAHGWTRWWDGNQWTAHAAPDNRQAVTAALASESGWMRNARIGLGIGAVLIVASFFANALILGHVLHQTLKFIRDAIHAADRGDPAPAQPSYTNLLWPDLGGVFVPIFALGWQIWLFRAATAARSLGLPAKRDPIWGILGFFIPVVNFWFPYQVMRDLFPEGDVHRSLVRQWWAWYLLQSAVGLSALIVAIFSTLVAVALAIFGAFVMTLFVLTTRRLITASHDVHESLVRS